MPHDIDWQTYFGLDEVEQAKILVDLAHELEEYAPQELRELEARIHGDRPTSIADRAVFARELARYMNEKKGFFGRSHKDLTRRMGPYHFNYNDVGYAVVYLIKGVWPR